MTDRQQPTGTRKQELDKKLTLDKEQLVDFEPKPEDDDKVRGGVGMSLPSARSTDPIVAL